MTISKNWVWLETEIDWLNKMTLYWGSKHSFWLSLQGAAWQPLYLLNIHKAHIYFKILGYMTFQYFRCVFRKWQESSERIPDKLVFSVSQEAALVHVSKLSQISWLKYVWMKCSKLSHNLRNCLEGLFYISTCAFKNK